jgi:hypothetical protein
LVITDTPFGTVGGVIKKKVAGFDLPDSNIELVADTVNPCHWEEINNGSTLTFVENLPGMFV